MTPWLPLGLTWLLQSSGLLALGLLALWLARRRGPAVQTLIGRATLIGVALALLLAAPLTGHVRPLWRVTLPAARPPALNSWQDRPPTPNSGGEGQASPQSVAVPAPTPAVSLPAPTALPDVSPAPASPLPRLYAALSAVWGAGTVLLLLWLGVCQWHLTRLGRAARPLTTGPAADILLTLTTRPPRLLAHPSVQSPFLAGLLRPTIFLPAAYETEFDPTALRAILAHELAHLARRDCAWTLFCRLLCALLWPQPLLWALCRKLEAVGEEACDLSVLACDCPPRAYADCLLTLAERWQPSRRERALGAGVAPFRSSVGRRIALLLAASRRPSANLTQRLKLGVAFCALLAVCGSVWLLNAGADVDVPHFVWAKRQGWTVRPIRIIDLDHPGLTRVASLPYDITERDKATLKQITDRDGFSYVPPGAKVSEKARLESVLATQPHFFYAEYLLGDWYRQNGDAARANRLQAQSLRDAPVILAGRYEYDDGTPVAGLQVETEIDCYSPTHLKAKSAAFRYVAVMLQYPDVITDVDGCYYIPIFRAIYSQRGSGWHPDELNAVTASHLKAHAALMTPGPATSGTTSSGDEDHLDKGFIAESRVAVMQQTEVRPKITLSAPFNAAEGSVEKPLLIKGSTVTISWRPYPNAVNYKVHIDEHHPYYDKQGVSSDEWSEIRASSSNPSRLGLPLSQTSIRLDFAGTDPVFNRTYPYTLTVQAMDRNGEQVSASDQYAFKPMNALAPQPLTKAALAQALGPGFTVVSIQPQKDKVVVNAITPANLHWSFAKDQALEGSGRRFGFSFGGWSSKPGLRMDAANAAQQMQIIYSHEGY